jgi:DNA polymerase-3 subunit gamma/tau
LLTSTPTSKPSTDTSNKPKTTLNLNSIFTKKNEPEVVKPVVEEVHEHRPLTDDEIRRAWSEYAEMRKSQVAEFHLLSRQVYINGPVVTVALANSVEEPLLQSITTDLVSYLRNRLKNGSIKVESVLNTEEVKRIAYTGKEKFDLLAEKNPILRELQDRLGLDPEF